MLYAGLDLSRKRLDFHLLDVEGATVEVGAAAAALPPVSSVDRRRAPDLATNSAADDRGEVHRGDQSNSCRGLEQRRHPSVARTGFVTHGLSVDGFLLKRAGTAGGVRMQGFRCLFDNERWS